MANLQLSSNLYNYRKLYGYTQGRLSKRLNISRQAYSNYETGRRDPDLDLLIRLADFYHITLDQLVHQPFSSRNSEILRENNTPYTTGIDPETQDILYLNEKETTLIMKYREADDAKRQVIDQILR
ncbi:MAG: helix-turn-helix transcriptional regulator [Schaedlerella sp.]|nr:helix-turn-helix transcriptional regulator [Lachnospiraceae bacterium]MDY4202912.1 helix-turn-helix transcriptional regulator [Schaedlerella sp.]